MPDEAMDVRERVWRERLRRRVGGNPPLDSEGVSAPHELVRLLADGAGVDDERAQRLGAQIESAKRRAEDEQAARLGLPPQPR